MTGFCKTESDWVITKMQKNPQSGGYHQKIILIFKNIFDKKVDERHISAMIHPSKQNSLPT